MQISKTVKIIMVVAVLCVIAGGAYAYAVFNRVPAAPPATPVVAEKNPPTVVKSIPVLVYHSIAPAPAGREGPLSRHYRVSPENFERQMKYLADNDYTPIRFDAYADYLLHDTVIPEKPVVITFDDGLLNQYDHALPILKKYGFTATFFVYPGVTGHTRFMTREQVRELSDAGFEIGSHSYIHEYLPKLTDPKILEREIVTSKKILEDMTGKPVTTLAYPNYAENESVRSLVRDAGYVAARAGWRDVQNSASEIFHLKAQEAVDTSNPFSSKVR